MKCTLYNVKDTKRVYISVEAKNVEEAEKHIKRIAEALEKSISKKWKYDIFSEGTAKTPLMTVYYVYLTFETAHLKIDKTIETDEVSEEELAGLKKTTETLSEILSIR